MQKPQIYSFANNKALSDEMDPVVITGIGLATSVGANRESVWHAIQQGHSGIRRTNSRDGFGNLYLPCGMVDWMPDSHYRLKSMLLTQLVAGEALQDANLDWPSIDSTRFATSISTQFGDIGYLYLDPERRNQSPFSADLPQWWNEFLPCSASGTIPNQFGLHGPRLCHATACASGLVSTIVGARMIQDGAADYALCGAADMVHEIMLASFHRMGVLADHEFPELACRPFDRERSGFVMGEGGAMMVLERRSHALRRGAQIYAEIAGTATNCVAGHVTDLDGAGETLAYLIRQIMRKSGWSDLGPNYINAHGTGTTQNDLSELLAIRGSLGKLADRVHVSSNKAVLGHLINAAGSVELALTALAIRDGYAPPTMNLHNQETHGDIDCLPELGVQSPIDRALKLSLAFGGHLVGIGLRKSSIKQLQRSPQPLVADALIRRDHQSATVSRAA